MLEGTRLPYLHVSHLVYKKDQICLESVPIRELPKLVCQEVDILDLLGSESESRNQYS